LTVPTLDENSLIAGRYRLESLIDVGGMGTVYRAQDERLHRPVAVKLVRTTDERAARRLEREAMLLARLDHPNIVRVYDVGQVEGRTYIVTEFVVGHSLQAIGAGGPIPPAEVAEIGRGIAAALDASHHAGIIHRDLKPANILVAETGEPRLLDYGIAAAAGGSGLTLEGELIGTPRYLSPEQARGEEVGASTDLYSLGLVLLECLTGRPVFAGSMSESLGARLVRDPQIPTEFGPDWADLLGRLTVSAPGRRPEAAEVAEALDHLSRESGGTPRSDHSGDPTLPLLIVAPPAVTSGGEPTMVTAAVGADTLSLAGSGHPLPRSTPPGGRRLRRGWLIAAAGVVAAVLGLIGLSLWMTPSRDPTPIDTVTTIAPPSSPSTVVTSIPRPATPTTTAPHRGRKKGP